MRSEKKIGKLKGRENEKGELDGNTPTVLPLNSKGTFSSRWTTEFTPTDTTQRTVSSGNLRILSIEGRVVV